MKEVMCNLAGFTYEHNLYFVEDGIVQASKPVNQDDMALEILDYAQEFKTHTIHLFGMTDYIEKFKEDIQYILSHKEGFNFSYQDLNFLYN